MTQTSVRKKFPSGLMQHDRDFELASLWKQPHLLDLSYSELEDKNLEMKEKRNKGFTSDQMEAEMLSYLASEVGIKAVTVCFSDIEGRLHTLDYDKKYLLSSHDNLTFDGSSIKGFTELAESDLRIKLDWSSFRWVPSDLFGVGKVLIFGNVCDKDSSFYSSDFRNVLMRLCEELAEKGMTVNVAPEIEGFLFKGVNAEQNFDEKIGFELATASGYYSSLPQDTLRLFIDKFAEAKRALGFQNEKDHPEVAPSQFELNYRYTGALECADQIQLYKLVARQVAKTMGFTASFLPKPIPNLNGSGMHTNISISKDGVNMFYDANGVFGISEVAHRFLTGILYYANDLCLVMNPSVNAYRRLDPNFEAPNEIKVSATDRGSMVRIPIGNKNSARIEVRTVAPDANPYICLFALLKAGVYGMELEESEYNQIWGQIFEGEVEILPADIYEALDRFEESEFMKKILGENNCRKYAGLKRIVAGRSPKALGHRIKAGEVLYHHELRNQLIWDNF